MKKVLTIAVVAMLATATLFAGVSFSGRFRQGYTFTFPEEGDATSAAWKTEEAKLVIKFSDDNGLWTVGLKNIGALDSNDKWAANASFDVTKALALGGMDLGDFSLAISLGNNSKMTALSAYSDPTGNEYYKLKNNGKESMQLAMGYGKLAKFNVAFDPTSDGGSIVISAKTEPVDGIALAAAYSYKGYFADGFVNDKEEVKDEDGDTVLGKFNDVYDVTADHVFGFSANADIAKLADIDFKLGVSAYDNIAVEAKEKISGAKYTYNSFAIAVSGGVDLVDAYAEFTMGNKIPEEGDAESKYGLNMQVNLNPIEKLALDVYYNIADLENAGKYFSVGADASYDLAGVEFALNADYTKAGEGKTGKFSLTPKMIIVF